MAFEGGIWVRYVTYKVLWDEERGKEREGSLGGGNVKGVENRKTTGGRMDDTHAARKNQFVVHFFHNL